MKKDSLGYNFISQSTCTIIRVHVVASYLSVFKSVTTIIAIWPVYFSVCFYGQKLLCFT